MKKINQILCDHRFMAALVFTLCFCSIVAGLLNTLHRVNPSGITDIRLVDDKTMEMFKMKLPERGVVTYITDIAYDLRTLSLLQYTLSPLILLHDRGQQRIIESINGPSGYEKFRKKYPRTEYIIGNFHSKSGYNSFCENNAVELMDTIGDRVMLFKRKRNPKMLHN